MRRSYSICSAKNSDLAIGVKKVENGRVSSYLNNQLKEGNSILVQAPEGRFVPDNTMNKVVAIAAGSGITPILSIAHQFNGNGEMKLFYGSKTESNIMFKSELDDLNEIDKSYFLAQEEKEGFNHGRLTKDRFVEVIKSDLELLKSDAYFICGPEEMIMDVKEALTLFGVHEDKIKFELFTTSENAEEKKSEPSISGKAKVEVELDGEQVSFELAPKGASILTAVNEEGLDAPYSCQGGVCSTCRAKVIEGKATMDVNYVLTDEEIAEGYILTCQAHPSTETLKVSYDD